MGFGTIVSNSGAAAFGTSAELITLAMASDLTALDLSANQVKLSADEDRLLHGALPSPKLRAVCVVNASQSSKVTIRHNSTTADEANRIICRASEHRVLGPNERAILIFDPLDGHWKVVS